ncbi:uncharacterized protein LOC132706630 isoform X2 [Cylas formicarius]|uniref:uncharacterized protein LOC132706630 isoform X2 n=1 Tax=Cylas formicarius TaxID=197179 RepID=UPI0029587BFE|nr:uncharacterized protein LOC132706630 isoform X2 [Cylas formicarius]
MTMPKVSILTFSKFSLISVGMWKLQLPIEYRIATKIYAVYSAFINIYFPTFVASLCIQFAISVSSDFDQDMFKQLSYAISLLITYYITLVTRGDRFTEIVAQVIEQEGRMLRSEDPEVLGSHLNEVRDDWRILLFFFTFTIGTGLTVILENFWYNMEVAIYNKKHNTTLERPITIDLYYFTMNKRKHETLVLIITELAVIFNTVILFSTKAIVFTCIMFASSALKELQIRFRKVGSCREDPWRKLNDLVVDHQKLIEFVRKLNVSIKFLVLLEYILNSLNMAAVSIQFLMSQNKTLLTPAFYFCFVLVQVFILGLTSDEIKVQSLKLSDSLYHSPWYNQGGRVKKNLLIVIARAQRPLELTIGPFNPMTMESALAVRMSQEKITWLT